MKIRINQNGAMLSVIGIMAIMIGVVTFDPVICTFFAFAFWLVGTVYALRDMRHNFAFLGYNVGFFTFILGGYLISFIENRDFSFFAGSYFSASSEAINHTCFSVMITAVVINSVYITFHKRKDEIIENVVDNNNTKIIQLRNFMAVVVAVSYVCKLYCVVTDMIVVKTISYRSAAQQLSSVPTAIVSISSLYFISLFIYWATIPSKRATVTTIVTLVIVEVINLLAGDRGDMVSVILTICFYVSFRNRMGLRDIRIKKKAVVAAVLMLPFIMYGLQAMSYIRNGVEYDESVAEGVASFMEAQGGSVKIIANAYDLEEEIDQLVSGKRTFVLGEIKRYLKSNIFARLIMGKSLSLRTVEDAKSGESFLQSYGYAYSPITYLSGVGSGSTYIAETYHDGGYFFLVIFNILIVVLLSKMGTGKSNEILKNAIMMNVFRYIPMLPRGLALAWLTNTFSIQNLFIFALLAIYLQGVGKGNQQ